MGLSLSLAKEHLAVNRKGGIVNQLTLVAELMSISTRTAPKAAGKDFIVTAIVEGEDLAALAAKMYEFGERRGKGNFDRDGANVRDSDALLLIGIKDAKVLGLNCAACGAEKCIKPNTFEGEFKGPHCAHRLLDMRMAIGSAVKTACLLNNVDNQVMYRFDR